MTTGFPPPGRAGGSAFGVPSTGSPTRPTDDPYDTWDAAYVLGSLSSNERREYENHLNTCVMCRAAVADLSGMPALLALFNRDEMAAAHELPPEPPPMRPELFDLLLDRVSWHRRRSRWMAWTVIAAAAVVLLLGVFIAVEPGRPSPAAVPPVTASAMTMTPVASPELAASFTLTSHDWGTHIDMTCTYHESSTETDVRDDGAGDALAMMAVGRDGSRVQLATWMAQAGMTARISGSTYMPILEMTAVQVVSVDSGEVLLERNL